MFLHKKITNIQRDDRVALSLLGDDKCERNGRI